MLTDHRHQGFQSGVKKTAVPVEIFYRPPCAAGFKPEEESVRKLRVGVVARGPANGRKAVFHFIAVMESRGGVHPAFVAGFEVGDFSNAAVHVECCPLFVLLLHRKGQGNVWRTRDGLMGHFNLFGRPFEYRGNSRFCVSSFAERHPSADALTRDGVGNKNSKITLLCWHFGEAFAAVGHIEDVQFEKGAFVKEARLACHGNEILWHKAKLRGKNTALRHANLPIMSRSFLQWIFLVLVVVSAGFPAWGQHRDEVAVVTFNVRYDNPTDPLTWDERKEKVVGSVSYFDLLGFQEALVHQVSDLAAGLSEHDYYGVGRDDGKERGEFCPIFWRRSRFDLLHSETLWLSPTPEEVGSVGWDAVLPRVATVVVLNDRQTDQVFRVVNAHFSHVGKQAREASAHLISSRISGSQADVNLVLGDLNAEPGSPALKRLTSGRLSDAHDATKKRCRSGIGTFTGFRTGGLRGAPRIDHILVDGGEVLWYCTEEQILGDFYMSDHLPVYIALMP